MSWLKRPFTMLRAAVSAVFVENLSLVVVQNDLDVISAFVKVIIHIGEIAHIESIDSLRAERIQRSPDSDARSARQVDELRRFEADVGRWWNRAGVALGEIAHVLAGVNATASSGDHCQ